MFHFKTTTCLILSFLKFFKEYFRASITWARTTIMGPITLDRVGQSTNGSAYQTVPRPQAPGTCFSKVPKLYGRISGDIILYVSSKLRPLEARNFAVIFIFNPFTTYEKTSFTEWAGLSLRMAFQARKVLGTFEKRAPVSRKSRALFGPENAIRLFWSADLLTCF